MDPRLPIGPIQPPVSRDAAQLVAYAASFLFASEGLHALMRGVDGPALERTYREGGWTVRQLVHHLADAHQQGFMRFRWGLTEANPVILPFDEAAWADLPDYALDPAVSLGLFDAVNARWVALLNGLDPAKLERTIRHPNEGEQPLWQLLAKHDWHARHHTAQIRLALEGSATPG